jgi:hypothetical protein
VEGAAEGVGMHHHRITFHSSRLLVARMRVKKKYYHVFTNLLDYIDGTFLKRVRTASASRETNAESTSTSIDFCVYIK